MNADKADTSQPSDKDDDKVQETACKSILSGTASGSSSPSSHKKSVTINVDLKKEKADKVKASEENHTSQHKIKPPKHNERVFRKSDSSGPHFPPNSVSSKENEKPEEQSVHVSGDSQRRGKINVVPHAGKRPATLQSLKSYPPPFYLFDRYNIPQGLNYNRSNRGQRFPSGASFRAHFQSRVSYAMRFQRGAQGQARDHLLSAETDVGHESDYAVHSFSGSKENLTAKRTKDKSHQRNRSSHSETACNEACHHSDDDVELQEPFSESDDEAPDDEAKVINQKRAPISLPIPRNRVRTLSGMVPNVGYAPVWGGPTMCLNCYDFFDLPGQTKEYVGHLLQKHRIAITDIELIVDLKRYIEYWRHRFGTESIEKLFPEVTAQEGDPLYGTVEKYFLMSDRLPEDRQIRERLALRRLEEVLACQQREREDVYFSRQCLFCRYHVVGNRAKLIHHLYMIHHLNLGSPDNLVFVNEYLDVLQEKLQNGVCIYCEQQFGGQEELGEHMRRNGHREVNPDNNYYDKFYVINYLELGKKWIEVLAEDFEDTMPAFVDSEEEEEEESWNEWQEDNVEDENASILCLFCDDVVEKLDALLEHLKTKHAFDLKREFSEEKMNFYDRVKYINYIRSCCHKCVCFACGKDDLHSWPALRKHLNNEATPGHVNKIPVRDLWDKEEYLIPTFDNDALLCFLDEFDDDQSADAALPPDPAIVDRGPVVLGADELVDGGKEAVNGAGHLPSRPRVLAEDAPDLSYTILVDKELREQLQ